MRASVSPPVWSELVIVAGLVVSVATPCPSWAQVGGITLVTD